MNETKNVESSKIANRMRSSLVFKLNMGMLLRLFSGFMAMNILILFLGLFTIAWKVEEGAQGIISTLELSTNNSQIINQSIGNYKILISDKPLKGFTLPNSIQNKLQKDFKKIPNTKRNIKITKTDLKLKLSDKLDLIEYNIIFTINETNYRIAYSLGKDLRLFLTIFIIILAFELLIAIGSIGKGAKSIREILKPLSELAETAKNLNAEVSTAGAGINDKNIKNLAGVISSIDANKLDRRISVDSSQNELKNLSSAINDMLNRINDSYQSQVRFVSDASHELRTPISVIQGYINLLDRWGKKDEKAMQESIDAIKSETQNMKELVEQLLFLARGDNETIKLQKENFDACQVVDEVIRETHMIDTNHIFEIDLADSAYINADKQLIKQAIRILVDNSIKYTPAGEKIILRVIKENNLVRITVQDSGIGIVPDEMSHIFDRFYRSDESRARKTGGSGLGLSIAKWIIEHHGAHFEILSRVDIGTRITIIIPIDRSL